MSRVKPWLGYGYSVAAWGYTQVTLDEAETNVNAWLSCGHDNVS